MCNSQNCSHNNDLDDSLDGLFDGPALPLVPAQVSVESKGALIDAPVRAVVETRAAAHGHRYEEKCKDCRGTGTWRSYSGFSSGQCFKCKGKGVLVFKTSPESREAAKNARERLAQQKAESLRENAELWKEANQQDWVWLEKKAGSFEFAGAMVTALHQFGSLTEKQHATVARLREQDAIRQAQWAAEKAERESNKAEIDIARIAQAFATAKANRLEYPKLRLADFVFSLAPEHGRNAGAIYVKSGDLYLGKVFEGRFTRSRDCTAELEAAIIAAAADPEAAASAYGLQTGVCSCCGRKLTNKDSVGLGIGPICRDKWGF